MNTMRYLCSLFGASTDDLVTAETPAGFRCQWEIVSNIYMYISKLYRESIDAQIVQ